MDRRAFVAFVGSAIATRLAVAASPNEIRGAIVDVAREYLRTTDWAPRPEFGVLDKVYYCNVFVADVCRKAGAATWQPIEGRLGALSKRDPVSREWEDPNFSIKGWKVIFHRSMNSNLKSAKDIFELRQPGDVIAGGGHMGILSDDRTDQAPKVFSASSVTGAIEANDWSYRLPDSKGFNNAIAYNEAAYRAAAKYTIRRFVGL